jgi:hypothetical protein
LVQRIYSSQATAAAPAVSFVGWAAASAASPAVVACAALAALVGGSGCSCACDAGVVVDGKVVPVGRNAVMGCGTRCGGLGEMQILEMEEGRAVVDFRAAKGFFQCYHRCVAAHKASKAGAGRLVEESILDVEGIGPGVSPYWVQEHAAELSGRTAVWRVLLAELPAESSADIVVYEGRVTGRIVPLPHGTAAPKRDSGFAMFNRPDDGSEGFEAVFVAEGDSDPLSSCITPVTDARAKARAAVREKKPSHRCARSDASAYQCGCFAINLTRWSCVSVAALVDAALPARANRCAGAGGTVAGEHGRWWGRWAGGDGGNRGPD